MCYPWCYPKNVTRACGACLCVEDLVSVAKCPDIVFLWRSISLEGEGREYQTV